MAFQLVCTGLMQCTVFVKIFKAKAKGHRPQKVQCTSLCPEQGWSVLCQKARENTFLSCCHKIIVTFKGQVYSLNSLWFRRCWIGLEKFDKGCTSATDSPGYYLLWSSFLYCSAAFSLYCCWGRRKFMKIIISVYCASTQLMGCNIQQFSLCLCCFITFSCSIPWCLLLSGRAHTMFTQYCHVNLFFFFFFFTHV